MRSVLAGGAVAFALVAGSAAAEPFTFVAIGDMPYRLPDDYTRFERLIARINEVEPTFTIHVGDIKSGSTPCSDEMLQKNLDYFATFERPLIYTPGDNEWTDCHRERAGRFDPLERLAKLRSVYFAGPARSLGKATVPLERQPEVMPRHAAFVENQRWKHEGVLFATVHMVGSNNGFERSEAMTHEFFARDAANVAWIEDTFAKAGLEGAPGVVFAFQADPLFQVEAGGEMAYANSGFRNALAAFAKGAETFGKPVLLLHGDSHVFIVDQPLKGADGEATLPNVYRLEVFGEDKVQAVRVTVDPDDPGVFGFRPLIIRENLETAKAG